MVVNFFTSNDNITKIFGNISFGTSGDNEFLNSLINISITLSIILLISSIFLIIIFIFKLFKSIIVYDGQASKAQIFETLKEFGIIILWTFSFILIFGVIFLVFDMLFLLFNNFCNEILNNISSENNNASIENIPSILYWIITGVELDLNQNPNFLFPDNYLEIANNMNFLFSIIFVLVFSVFMIWTIWIIFQKMIEIIFLYLTFPVSLSLGMEIKKINWRIWLKEIFNKMFLIFVVAFLLRAFLYLFYLIHSNLIMETWNKSENHQAILYMNLFVVLALSGAIIFIIKIFSYKSQENIGLINSFKQTKNFITYKQDFNYNSSNHLSYIKPNENISLIRNDIINFAKNNQINYSSLKKVKVFNK